MHSARSPAKSAAAASRCIDWDWERLGLFRIQENWPPLSDVAFSTVCSGSLLVDHLFSPTAPSQVNVLGTSVKSPIFSIKEDQNLVFKHNNEVAQFLAINAKWVRIAPELKECPVTKFGKQSLGRSDTFGL